GRCAGCGYEQACADASDCASGVCLTEVGVCGCGANGDCPAAQVCDVSGTQRCFGCLADGDCAGVDDVCAPEVCDVASECLAQPVPCDVQIFYGVVAGPGGELGSVRCWVSAQGGAASCEMDGDALKVGPPMCG